VHEVENGTSIDVAASIIIVDAANRNIPIPSLTATGRPRRSRKCRGVEGGVYSVDDVEMALDGNLAHLRLLLHQTKRKKILGQKLFLLHTSPPQHDDAPLFTELTMAHNENFMHEIVSLSDSNNEVGSADKQKDYKIHLVLSYDDNESSKPYKRKRLNKVDKDEEDDLILSLSNISSGGWKSDDGNAVMGGKQSKRRKQERGFQGTFLQSTELDERANLSNTQIANSPNILQRVDSVNGVFIDTVQDDPHVARAHDDIKDTKMKFEINSAVISSESNWDSIEPACEATSRCKAPAFSQSTELDERGNQANILIENSLTVLQRVDSEDVVFIDTVQDDQHVPRGRDAIKNTQMEAEEEINRAVTFSESKLIHIEPACEADSRSNAPTVLQSTELDEQDNLTNVQIAHSSNTLQRVDTVDVVFIDTVQDEHHVARARDDIKVGEEFNSDVVSAESNRDSIAPVREAESISKTPKHPFCEVFVHEVERGNSIDVAVSIILVDASKHVTPSLPATKRASRSRKSLFATYQVKMALDGNLAHLRLLLRKENSKQLCGQRLYLVHTTLSECKNAPLFTELAQGYDKTSMREVMYQLPSGNEVCNSEPQVDCKIHLVLSYDDDSSFTLRGRRKRLNQEATDEEARLKLSLSDIAYSGWSTANCSPMGGKQTNRCRQEKDVQGVSLLSPDETSLKKFQQDCLEETIFDCSKASIDDARAQNEIIDMKSVVGEETTKAVDNKQSNHTDAKLASKSETMSSSVHVHGLIRRIGL
jgi:hypothetical protein